MQNLLWSPLDGDVDIKSLIQEFESNYYDYSLLVNSLKLKDTKVVITYSSKLHFYNKSSIGKLSLSSKEFISSFKFDLNTVDTTNLISSYLKKRSKFKRFTIYIDNKMSTYPNLSIDLNSLSMKSLNELVSYMESL